MIASHLLLLLCHPRSTANVVVTTVKAVADIGKAAAPAVKALPYIGPVVTIIDTILLLINNDGQVQEAFANDGTVPKELELLKVINSLQPVKMLSGTIMSMLQRRYLMDLRHLWVYP
jgi:hypothetical protein